MNMPTRTTKPKAGRPDPTYPVPILDLARRCGGVGTRFGAEKALPILETWGLKPGEVQKDWAGHLVVASTVAARVVNGYEKDRIRKIKEQEEAAAQAREQREIMLAGGYTIPEDPRGPLMTGLTYAEFRAEEARRGNYPPPPSGVVDGPSVGSPEEARALRQAKLDKMNADAKARGRAATPPRSRR